MNFSSEPEENPQSEEETRGLLRTCLGMPEAVIETGCELIKSLLGEPFKVAGGMLADQVYAWRWRNRIRIAKRAEEIMAEEEIPARVLPPGFLLPLLDAAGDVEDPDLQQMWARLLASGVREDRHQHPMLVDTLRRMSREDAEFLVSVVKQALREERENQGSSHFPPHFVVSPDHPAKVSCAGRLLTLGLIGRGPILSSTGPPNYQVSSFGHDFYEAVCGD